jgi:F-type H+-transporting ATPase subunit delta
MVDALSSHYAEALADGVFAPNSGITPEEAVAQLKSAVEVFASSPDLKQVLMSPAVPREKKTQVVGAVLSEDGLHRLIRNFLMVIVEHRRTAELERIENSFEAAVDKRQGYVRADIISAVPLTDSQREELLHALGTKVGKFIRPVYQLDKNIVGGVIARFGSREYDGSVTGRLEAMRRRLSTSS